MLTAAMPELKAGDTLDHYRLDAEVSRTGMSTLFRATDLRTGRTVAVKLPHAEMEADPILIERFRREEEIGQQIDHPGVVKTCDGEERSRLYMVVEWVDGRLLRSILNENIMVLDGDRIKIIDFGIAMKEDARRLTHASLTPALGTPDYISPEQVKGHRGDQRSDIYSLGAMLYEMLTGQPPFTGANALVVLNERVLSDAKPVRELNPEVSPQLEEILFRALERDPRNRYATAAEMAWELEHQELVGVDEDARRPSLRTRLGLSWGKLAFYAGFILVPVALFVMMLLLARK
jgi:serine/threonine protein kinase